MNLPQEPVMLYSMINMKLRDTYTSLRELCLSEQIDQVWLEKTLGNAGFEYISNINQFR